MLGHQIMVLITLATNVSTLSHHSLDWMPVHECVKQRTRTVIAGLDSAVGRASSRASGVRRFHLRFRHILSPVVS